jgi:Neurotransmitter-gated ion-channel ligand binding domain/Neurotransmitter-gated ion-channel transmembrane region
VIRKTESSIHIHRSALALGIALLLAVDMGIARGADVQASLPPAPLRPDAGTEPTKISIGIWASDISKIDSATQTFTASVFVSMRWHDARLAHSGPEVRTYSLTDIWHPELLVANDDGSVKRTLPETAEVASDGTVVYRQRFTGSFAQRLDLRAFPFDQHRFFAHFLVVGYRPEEVQFIPDEALVAAGLPQGVGIAETVTLADWKADAPRASARPYHAAPGLKIAGYVFEFHATRLAQYYLLKVILPLLLIVMMSWTVFWIDPTNGGPQISVAVTSMLTLIAYRFAIGSEVPKLPYLTRLDAFILASSILVFLSLIEVMLTIKLATDNRIDLARLIDRRCRILFPIAFIAASAAIFLR